MSYWTKSELENMLEDVVNELDLSGEMVEKHGKEGSAPAELVRLVLEEKDKQIRMLKAGMKPTDDYWEEQLTIKEKKCEHENEIMRQGDGTVYGYCGDCGKELHY